MLLKFYRGMKANFYKGIISVLMVAGVFALNSCYKEPFYKAQVIVENIDGDRIEDAAVRMYTPVNLGLIDTTMVTGASGSVQIEFELDAVIEIQVFAGALSGDGFIQLEENKTVTEVIVVE